MISNRRKKIHQTWSTHFSQYLYKRTLGRTIPLVISRLNIQDEDLVSPRPCGLTNRGKAGNHHPILFFFCPPPPPPLFLLLIPYFGFPEFQLPPSTIQPANPDPPSPPLNSGEESEPTLSRSKWVIIYFVSLSSFCITHSSGEHQK